MMGKKNRIRILSSILILVLLFSFPVRAKDSKDLKEQIEETAGSLKEAAGSEKRYLLDDEEVLPAGSSLSDWTAMALVFSGRKEAYESYVKRLEAYVTEQYETRGTLDSFKATEYHRIALTALALGKDPTAFGTDRNGNHVNLIFDGIYNFPGDGPGQQGSNGLIYALLALDAGNYEVPENARYTREILIDELCGLQAEEGGFGLTEGSKGDVDLTAMALQALAPYREQEQAALAVEKACRWLSGQMTENGTFFCYGSESAESSAQVILAVCALGMEPDTTEAFLKNGVSLLDGLETFRLENGLYMHTRGDRTGNLMATEQALLALEAVERLRTTGNFLFDFTDYQFQTEDGSGSLRRNLAVAAVILLAAGGVCFLIIQKRKTQKTQEMMEHV